VDLNIQGSSAARTLLPQMGRPSGHGSAGHCSRALQNPCVWVGMAGRSPSSASVIAVASRTSSGCTGPLRTDGGSSIISHPAGPRLVACGEGRGGRHRGSRGLDNLPRSARPEHRSRVSRGAQGLIYNRATLLTSGAPALWKKHIQGIFTSVIKANIL
jgi:hypothetical protein